MSTAVSLVCLLWLQHWELESLYWEESVQCQRHSPLKQLYHILCQVCSNRRQHLVPYIGMPCRAVAGKVRGAERVLLKEDSYASIYPSLSHIARRSVRP